MMSPTVTTQNRKGVALLRDGGSGFWDGVVGVASFVDALVFLIDVVGPVGVEVAVRGQGTEFEDGLGAVQAPAGAGDVEAVFDQVAAGALDDAGGDRPALGESGGIVQVGPLVGQVLHAPGDTDLSGAGRVGGGGGQVGDDLVGVSGQHPPGLAPDPVLGGRVGPGVQTPGRGPQVFQ